MAVSIWTLLERWQQATIGSSHPQPPVYNGREVFIQRFVEDSRQVQPGDCFVARVRTSHNGTVYSDGHPYIAAAIQQGAALVIGEKELGDWEAEVAYLQVEDSALALAWLSAAWHNFPSQQLVMIGVTGTDGKTSTTNLIYSILQQAGVRAGMISTINAHIGDQVLDTGLHVTTPEAPAVQAYLRQMVDAGITHCVLECTSHGLAQHRVSAISFDLAVVTNITHEHLDYHGSWEGYLQAKARLFHNLTEPILALPTALAKLAMRKTAILNSDDRSFPHLQTIPITVQIQYGVRQPADVWAEKIQYGAEMTQFELFIDSRAAKNAGTSPLPPAPPIPYRVRSPLVGEFNIYNMLAAAAATDALGISQPTIVTGLQAVKAISGRMQRIYRQQPFIVIVDFAHTPNALQNALQAARAMTTGKIIAVFGSAGKRDIEKRRIMAEISAQHADLTVLTAEDPRTEPLSDILEMMASGCRRYGGVEGSTFWRVPDRGEAIYFALHLAQKSEDLVIICGKGHEQSLCFGTIEYPWDDRTATIVALDAFLSHQPMPNLGLPTFSTQK